MARQHWVWGLFGLAMIGALGLAWKSTARNARAALPGSESETRQLPPLAMPPAPPEARTVNVATERQLVQTDEQRRMRRYDKDSSGTVSADEFLSSRKKAFAKLDVNGDGSLSFGEYAIKTAEKFSGADADHNRQLSSAELMTTAQKRTARANDCPPDTKVDQASD
jgi:EF hand